LLACPVQQLGRSRRVPLSRSEQSRCDWERQLAHGGDELRRILLMAMSTRVRQSPEQLLRVRVLGTCSAVLDLACGAREAPGPTGEDLLRRVRLALAERLQQAPDARDAVLLPLRR